MDTVSYGRHRAARGSGLSYSDPFVPEVCLLGVDKIKLICVKLKKKKLKMC